MSLDKSRIPKRGNSSRKFIPEKQRKTMTDPFVDWIKRSRSDKRGTVSGRMVETRSQKTSEERRKLLEVEVNTDQTMNDNQEVNGLEGRGRRLASESTPVEQGHDFATSTGTRGLVGETGMQCAHQQLGRDSPELCHGQEALST